MPLPAALAFLANPAFWQGAGNVASAAGSIGSIFGGGGSSGGQSVGGQTQPTIMPQNMTMPSQMMASRQMPSYGSIIQQMLAKQRGF